VLNGALLLRDEILEIQNFPNLNQQNHLVMVLNVKLEYSLISSSLREFYKLRLLPIKLFEKVRKEFHS
jgi:hypothetical protein